MLFAADWTLIRFSDSFADGQELLKAATRLGLEGIVSKKRKAPYVAGARLRLGEGQGTDMARSEPRALRCSIWPRRRRVVILWRENFLPAGSRERGR